MKTFTVPLNLGRLSLFSNTGFLVVDLVVVVDVVIVVGLVVPIKVGLDGRVVVGHVVLFVVGAVVIPLGLVATLAQ